MTLPAPRKRQALKKACVTRWKMRAAVGADAERQEHVAELGDRRVGEHLLDVVLDDGDRRREERRQPRRSRRSRADASGACRYEPDMRAHQVDARGHHGRGMDQRGDRRRAGHGVGQPDVQRDLRRLARRAEEEQDADQARRTPARRRAAVERGVDAVHVERAERLEQHEHADQEAGVADAVDDERLLAGARVSGPRTRSRSAGTKQADAFPADEEHEQRPAQDQHQHEEQEQVQVGEEARVAASSFM